MDIAVIGTSNSIRRHGWVSALRAQRPQDSIHNLSIGANCSAYGVYAASAYKALLKQCSIVVIDFCVNDGNFIARGLSTERVKTYASAIYADVAKTSCPVALLLPTRSSINTTDSPAHEIHRNIATEHGIPIIDAVELTRRLARLAGVKPETLFENDVHLSPPIAQVMGVLVSRWIDHIKPAVSATAESIATHMQGKTASFAAIPAAEIAAQTLHRQNSHMSVDLAEIRPGQPLAWKAPSPVEIHGIFVNSAQTENVTLTTQSEVAKSSVHVTSTEHAGGKTLLMKLETMDEPLPVDAGGTMVLSIAPFQQDEDRVASSDGSSAMGEIGGVLVKFSTPRKDTALEPCRRLSQDELPRPGENEIEAVLGAAGSLLSALSKERLNSSGHYTSLVKKPLYLLAKALLDDNADPADLRFHAAEIARICHLLNIEKKLLEKTLHDSPESPRLLMRQGKKFMNLSRYDEALEAFRRAKQFAKEGQPIRADLWIEKAAAAIQDQENS